MIVPHKSSPVNESRRVAGFSVTGLEVGGVAPGRPVAENPDGPEDPDATEDHP